MDEAREAEADGVAGAERGEDGVDTLPTGIRQSLADEAVRRITEQPVTGGQDGRGDRGL